MIAASVLVVAVLASYAGIGMLSLTATSSFNGLRNLPGVNAVVSGIGWNPPSLKTVTAFGSKAASGTTSLGVFSDVTGVFDLGKVTESAGPAQLPLKNTSSSPVHYSLKVSGTGLSASFDNHSRQVTLAPKHSALVLVSSNALYAGPINGQLVLYASGFGSQTIPIQGTQAPLPAGAVTAKPAKGGAVNLSWAPSGSVSGVAGYIVQRSTDGTAWTPVTSVLNATTAVDQTPADAAYSYRVVAVSEGSLGAQSGPSPVATATSDSTAPASPSSVSAPTFIRAANVSDVSVTVALDQTTSPSDTITVTLTGPSGHTATGTAPGGSSTVTVTGIDASNLSESPDDATPTIAVSATATDSLGNVSKPTSGNPVVKDTLAPGAPTFGQLPVITEQNQHAYPVAFQPTQPSDPANDTFHLSAQAVDAGGNPIGQPDVANGPVGDGPPPMDISDLADGNVQFSASITDAAGNRSPVTQSDPVTKDTSGPPAPTTFQIAAGPNNPVNVVTPQSAQSVYITATFAQAPTTDDEIKVFGDNRTLVDQQGDGQTTTFTFGPFDFSDLQPGGPYKIGMNQIDGLGNDTWWQDKFTVDGGAQGPTGVGVPAGPNNPAGYVNAATQTAATIVATFAAPTDPADQIALSVDGLSLGTQSGGGDSVSWTGDLSSLPDGTLDIQGTITDPNGVTSTFTGSLIKDTTPPPAPAVAGVVGPPPNVITPDNASCVKVGVAFNQAPDPSDTVTATLSDGSNSVQGTAPAGDGQVTVDCIDASSLAAGPVSVTVTVTDVAGNSVTFTGTPAAKVACQPAQNQGQN